MPRISGANERKPAEREREQQRRSLATNAQATQVGTVFVLLMLRPWRITFGTDNSPK